MKNERNFGVCEREQSLTLGMCLSLALCCCFVLQVAQGYPARAGESGGGVEETHRARAAGQPRGEDHQGCRGEPQEQRVHLLMGDDGWVL
jgi:hypothetical protein